VRAFLYSLDVPRQESAYVLEDAIFRFDLVDVRQKVEDEEGGRVLREAVEIACRKEWTIEVLG
jgi:hypothetical protein